MQNLHQNLFRNLNIQIIRNIYRIVIVKVIINKNHRSIIREWFEGKAGTAGIQGRSQMFTEHLFYFAE